MYGISNLKVTPPILLRLDGRDFHRFTTILNLERPFDEKLKECFVNASKRFMEKSGFDTELTFTFSDEVNFLLMQNLPFNGRVEKILSIATSTFTSFFFNEIIGTFPHLEAESFLGFDSRIVKVNKQEEIMECLKQRQSDCFRNHNNAFAQWCLIKKGIKTKEIDRILRNKKSEDLRQLCLEFGIDLNQTLTWQRRGILLRWITFVKDGFDPIRKENVKAIRRKIIVEEAPIFK